MEAKLTAELPGILAWAVDGCLAWQRQGLKPAAAVMEATQNYQSEMDVLAAWFADCCVVKKHCETKAADLYASYCAWCEQTGEYPEKQRKFGMRLTERGFERFRSTGGDHFWRGIGLRLSSTQDTQDTQKTPFSKNSQNSNSYSDNCREWVTSVTSVTNEKPPASPPVETVPLRPLTCTWRPDDGRLITKCSDPDLQRDEAGNVVCCANCGEVQP